MDHAITRPASLDSARRTLLEHVALQGPTPAATLPHRWPLTGHHLRLMVGDLSREGLVRIVHQPPGRQPLVAITPEGRAVIDAIDIDIDNR